MPNVKTTPPTSERRLRLWPGVIAAGLLLLVRFGVPLVMPGFEGFRIAMLSGLLGILVTVGWWLFLSRNHSPLSRSPIPTHPGTSRELKPSSFGLRNGSTELFRRVKP